MSDPAWQLFLRLPPRWQLFLPALLALQAIAVLFSDASGLEFINDRPDLWELANSVRPR